MEEIAKDMAMMKEAQQKEIPEWKVLFYNCLIFYVKITITDL
jgi:hypothetical protein